MDLLAAVEAVGFDFALIGTIVTIVLVMCGRLAFRPAAPVERTAIAALAFMRRRLRGGRVPELVLWGAIVGVVGMTFNVIADETFDNDDLLIVRSRDVDERDSAVLKEQKTRLFGEPSCGRPRDEIQWPILQRFEDEDGVKQDAARDVCERTGPNSPARDYIEPYTSADGSKELAQIASAELWRTGSAASNTALRVEFLAVKMARVVALTAAAVGIVSAVRVLWVAGWLLAVAIVPVVLRRVNELERAAVAGMPAHAEATHLPAEVVETLARQPESRAAALPGIHSRPDVAFERRQLRALVILLTVAVGLAVLGVWMWELQSRRYYMKLFYVHLDARQLDTRQRPIVPGPLAAASLSAASVPALVTEGSFVNADPKTGTSSMYEFSGVTQFNGRIIVVDNETDRLRREPETDANALFLVTVGVQDGQLAVTRPLPGQFPVVEGWDDIEGLASDRDFVYAIGSHSLDTAGRVRLDRRVLLRLRPRIGDGPPPEVKAYAGLYEALSVLAATLHLPAAAASPPSGAPPLPVIKDLNIEGLEIAPTSGPTKDLLLGLRSPLIAAGPDRPSLALVVRLHDVDALFAGKSGAAAVAEEARLDLGGRGIAAIERDPRNDGYLLAAAPASEGDPSDYSSLWLWRPADPRQTLKELIRFPGHKLEGIGRITWKDKPALLLAFDEEEKAARGTDAGDRQFGRLAVLQGDQF